MCFLGPRSKSFIFSENEGKTQLNTLAKKKTTDVSPPPPLVNFTNMCLHIVVTHLLNSRCNFCVLQESINKLYFVNKHVELFLNHQFCIKKWQYLCYMTWWIPDFFVPINSFNIYFSNICMLWPNFVVSYWLLCAWKTPNFYAVLSNKGSRPLWGPPNL